MVSLKLLTLRYQAKCGVGTGEPQIYFIPNTGQIYTPNVKIIEGYQIDLLGNSSKMQKILAPK